MIAFISGHLNISKEEFAEHYIPKIQSAIDAGHHFIVGDARGTDIMAQQYLLSKNVIERTTVYHMFTSPRNCVEGAWRRESYSSDDERDTAMTTHSNYDIAWVRPGREDSGTQQNLNRRNP